MKNKKFGSKKDVLIVNSITALRFLGSFLVIPIFKFIGGMSAAIFSAIFLLTDFIDGFLARRLNSSTFFGALFDGITDKMFGIISFLLLMAINPIAFSLPLLLEFGIILAQNKKFNNDKNIKSNIIGKIKTWVLGFSIVGAFGLIDFLNMPPFLEYIKYSSLEKVANIEDYLKLFGLELPLIITQILTLKSYIKEADDIEDENEIVNELEEENSVAIEENTFDDPNITLQEIEEQKLMLQEEKNTLEKIKVLMNAMLDPEYYYENKDMPIRTLVNKLFDPNKK